MDELNGVMLPMIIRMIMIESLAHCWLVVMHDKTMPRRPPQIRILSSIGQCSATNLHC